MRRSTLGRVWASIAKHGIRTGLRDAVARWSRRESSIAHDVIEDYGWILGADRPAMRPAPGGGPLTINWLIPNILEASGGHLSILRAVYHLEQWGHRNRIYMIGRTTQSAERATAIARSYYPIQALVELFDGKVADSDALVATLWMTAYFARALSNTARKFYFVQDLEHLFYPPGSLCEFAKETYRWGFHGITVGQWVADELQREFNMECSAFGFSYDREVYSPNGSLQPQRQGKKRVLFYARPATERRGFELGVLALSLVAKEMPDTEFVLVGFPFRPSQLPFPAILPGIVSPSELAQWYRSSSVALVLSSTNLSLVPLEIMACGCPLVSNSGPNVEWLLSDRTAQLADPTPEALASAVVKLLQDGEMRARKVAAALAFVGHIDLACEMKRIESAFYQGLGIQAAMAGCRDGAS